MNKTLLIASSVAAFIFASCTNDNTTNPEPTATVTIKGVVVADLDEDEDEFKAEKIPAGVSLYFLNDDGALLATGTTTADGYTQELQIGGPQTIWIVVGDFQTNINVFNGVDDFESKPAVYNEREQFSVDVVKGGTFIQNIEIDQPAATDF
jgi:hypothetical protein